MIARLAALGGALLLLAACGGIVGELKTVTPAQGYYAALGTYDRLVEATADYAQACAAKPAPLRQDCLPIVADLQRLDHQAEATQVAARQALAAGGEPADLAALAFEEAVDRLEAYLAAEAAQAAGAAGGAS